MVWPVDEVRDALEHVKDVTTETVRDAAGAFDAAGNRVTDFATDVVARGVQVMRSSPLGDLLGLDGASPDDGGSSRWENWEHQAIRHMLDTTVKPTDIDDGALEWVDAKKEALTIITGVTGDLSAILEGGWGGESGAEARGSLGPINSYVEELSSEVERTHGLLTESGEAAAQARAQVEPAVEFNPGQTLRKAVTPVIFGGGAPGAGLDVIAQDRAQKEAHAEAVRKMYALYSTPINAQREQVPAAYPRLQDPTLQPPEPVPGGSGVGGWGTGGSGAGVPVGAASSSGGSGGSFQPPPSPFSAPPGAGTTPQYAEPSAPAASAGQAAGGAGLGQGADQPPQGSRYGGGAGAGVPVGTQGMGAGGYGAAGHGGVGGYAGAGGYSDRGGHRGAGGGGGYGSGGFGPRGVGGPGGSGLRAPGGAAPEGSPSAGGAGSGGRGGGSGRGMGGGMMPMGMGAGRGQGGEDSEHRRKYLVEEDENAIAGVLPPTLPVGGVIGEDPPSYDERR